LFVQKMAGEWKIFTDHIKNNPRFKDE